MSEKELIAQTIEKYTNLQRIMKAADPQKEMENQKRILEVMLQAMGVVTEKLEIEYSGTPGLAARGFLSADGGAKFLWTTRRGGDIISSPE